MSDLISRAAAIEAIGDVHPLDYNKQAILERIKALPSAEKVGKWITKHPYRDDFGKGARLDLRFHFPSCSNCGAVFGYTPYYCPNCGSKMKNGTEWFDWDTGYGVQEGEEDDIC